MRPVVDGGGIVANRRRGGELLLCCIGVSVDARVSVMIVVTKDGRQLTQVLCHVLVTTTPRSPPFLRPSWASCRRVQRARRRARLGIALGGFDWSSIDQSPSFVESKRLGVTTVV